MSRVVVYDASHQSVGEFQASVDRGYMLYGNPGISGELTAKAVLTTTTASMDILQFGRRVLIEHPTLPPWMGVIDPPWKAIPPVELTLYGGVYLLSLRMPDNTRTLKGSAAKIIAQMIGDANSQSDLFVRLGESGSLDSTAREELLTQKTVWEQVRAFAEKTGTEITMRPQVNDGRLYLYLDVSNATGVHTDYLLHDDQDKDQPNFEITDAVVDGLLTNRVIGISSQNTAESRVKAGPFIDDEMRGVYDLRSEVVQFRDVTVETTMELKSQAYLDFHSRPRLVISGDVLLKDTTAARSMRLGNWFIVHTSKAYLPGGVQGWRGEMRLIKFFYSEKNNTANVTMEAFL